jgi:hypothetical protein
MLRRIATVLAVMTIAVIGFAAPAHADACGAGPACDGRDPYTVVGGTTCASDAYTKLSRPVESGSYIELRWSPHCQTAWARSSVVGTTIKVDSAYSNGTYRTTYSSYRQEFGPTYTLIVSDGPAYIARACQLLHASGPDAWVCTGWW